MRKFALVLVGMSAAVPAFADVSQQIAQCRAETDSLKRLTCYDAIQIDEDTDTSYSTPSVIARFSGTGMTTTRPFTASGPFVVRIETSEHLSLEVKSPSALFGEAHLSTDGSATAEVYVSKGGKYVLEVLALDSWKATVIRSE